MATTFDEKRAAPSQSGGDRREIPFFGTRRAFHGTTLKPFFLGPAT
jgi:hypothetical protein